MKRFLSIVCVLLSFFTIGAASAHMAKHGHIVVANRNDGTLSVIDTNTHQVTQTLSLPASAHRTEPMYVVHVAGAHRFFVGDRGNNRVVVFNDSTFEATNTVAVGAGVFHMWANQLGTQLWVTGDVDKTLSIIDPYTLNVKTIDIPEDIKNQGGKPHDVILDDWPLPSSAYVSFVGLSGQHDYVVKFSTRTLKEKARIAVGKDPHLSLNLITNKLYIASQNAGQLYTVKRSNLKLVDAVSIPGAHGVSLFPIGVSLYVSDITSPQGENGLYQWNILDKTLKGSPVDTGFGTTHNLAQDGMGKTLYITHSGAASNEVSYYTINPYTGKPERQGHIQVGLNPFGLAFVG